jgi:hypothetical protein
MPSVFLVIFMSTNVHSQKDPRWYFGPYLGASYSMIRSEGPATDFSVATVPAPYVGIDVLFRMTEGLYLESGWGFFQPAFLMQYKDETLTTSKIRMRCFPLRIKSIIRVGRRHGLMAAFGMVYDPISIFGNSSYNITGSNYRFDLSHSSSNGILLSPSLGLVLGGTKQYRHEIEAQGFIGNGHVMQGHAYYFNEPENSRTFYSKGRTWAIRYRFCFGLNRKK